MDKFSTIYKRAVTRKGGKSQLESFLPRVLSGDELLTIPDDRVLSEMSRCVFQAGFVWRVVNQKWEGFEKAFFGFVPEKLVLLSPEQLDVIGKDKSIVRNMQKIISVQKNAQWVLDEAKQHGSCATMLQQYSGDKLQQLYSHMKKMGSRLGGMTGPRVLRNLGFDSYLLTNDVVLCLQQAGVEVSSTPTSKKDLALIQTTFDTWHHESGRPYSHLSRICACAIGDNHTVLR